MLSFCSVGSRYRLFFYHFCLACVFRYTPTVLSASALDIALIKFLCLPLVSICVVFWLVVRQFCGCFVLCPCAFWFPMVGGSSYSALVDLGSLLCASILDPVQSLGSTKGWVPFCFPCFLSLPTFALFPLSYFLCFSEKLGRCSYRPRNSRVVSV